jgi:hypothetical protein
MIVFLAHPAGFGRKKSVKDTVGDDGLRLLRKSPALTLNEGVSRLAARLSKTIGGCAYRLPVRFAPRHAGAGIANAAHRFHSVVPLLTGKECHLAAFPQSYSSMNFLFGSVSQVMSKIA